MNTIDSVTGYLRKSSLKIYCLLIGLMLINTVAAVPIIFYKRNLSFSIPPFGSDEISTFEEGLSCIKGLLPRNGTVGCIIRGGRQEFFDFYYSLTPILLKMGSGHDFIIVSLLHESDKQDFPDDHSYDLVKDCLTG